MLVDLEQRLSGSKIEEVSIWLALRDITVDWPRVELHGKSALTQLVAFS